MSSPSPLIGITGVCGAGKSTLAGALRARGYNARQVSQEHSGVPDLWRRFTHADVLIYLDASLETVRRRLADPDWPDWLYAAQRGRTDLARRRCDFCLATDDLNAEEVLEHVVGFLQRQGLSPAGDAQDST